ncbi:SUMF1/EgtB/PvdO family nonheme iron enzyme [Gemmatimonadota bacterium]
MARVRKSLAAMAGTTGRFLRRPFVWGVAAGMVLLLLMRAGNAVTSTDRFCQSCHVHPQATSSWRQSTHFATKSGTVTHCVECHLPPAGLAYGVQKTRLGVRDAVGALLKDPESFDWEERSQLEHARAYVFRASCLECHPNLFPIQLTDEGEEAHLHYEEHAEEVRCLNCHLHVGHFDPEASKEIDFGLTQTEAREIYSAAATVEGFQDYTELIPGTTVSFDMVAIPGGTFEMGSPPSEAFRNEDEGPVRRVTVGPFWMGRIEVTWNEFEAWYRATRSEGRTDTQPRALGSSGMEAEVDAVTGATPPYVPPDQGWGKGERPAITMTHLAAVQYTRWLSEVTGRRYRLPTEAEWEYAARGGTETPYFFEGDPRQLSTRRFWTRILGQDTELLDTHVIHRGNSGGRTQPPAEVSPNPFGLVNMLGNVREFCLDWYAPDAYGGFPGGTPVADPQGPSTGTEHVVRGGSFRSEAEDLRSAARDHTRTGACLLTDPQIPKSRWWYSDCADIGFRVVAVFREEEPEGSGG